MIVNQQTIAGINTGFSVCFNKALSEASINYPSVAMVIPSETREMTYAWLGKIPRMKEWVGERQIENLLSHSYTIVNKTFESTVSVPVNDIADDQCGIYTPVFSEMGLAAATHPDELVFNLLGNGFTKKGYDNVAFFSDSHPYFGTKKSVNQSNKGTKKLTAKSYAEARCQMMTIKGDDDKSLKIVPDLLVVSPQNEAIAREILFADLIQGSSNVNKNTCQLLVIPELVDFPDQWYLLCTKRQVKPIVFQEREKPKLVCKNKDTDDNVFFKDEIIYGVKSRYNVGFGLWQLAYGSTGEEDETTGTV